MFAAVLMFFSLAALDQASTMPSYSCLASARTIAESFQPAADQMVGHPLKIQVIGGVKFAPEPESESTDQVVVLLPARIVDGKLEINKQFCGLPSHVKESVIVHEIGHLVDFDSNPAPTCTNAAWSAEYSDRPWEIEANKNAKILFLLKTTGK